MLISLSDVFYSIGNMMANPSEGSAACYIQALLISYFELSSMFWTVAIAYTLHQTIIKGNMSFATHDLQANMKLFHQLCWGVPLVLTILPFTTDSYGRAGAWCWISTERGGDAAAGTAWRFIQFYLPLWACIGYNSWVYFHVSKKLVVLRQSIPESGGDANARSYQMLERVKFYPLVLVLCYLFGTINRIYQIFGNPVFWLAVLHTLGASSQGIGNSIVYGLTPAVRSAFLGLIERIRHGRQAHSINASQLAEHHDDDDDGDGDGHGGQLVDDHQHHPDDEDKI
eukprot:TRINITY_DN59281_c0_g1_i1.p2 TRINITY_DN59281_c0_g1~~TRINITY_DN59281_c0_g1_i1.p2  ORF type:complete len:284 (-),score=133.68 TRINITY_DN59281_c0_g1_i1:48-899(-)